MPSASKVVWSEGMLLRTQHFQQQDRWVEQLVRGALAGAVGHGWGVSELALDRQLLPQGKVGVARCRGILPDGTPFALPEDGPLPDPVTVDRATRPGVVYLALPLRQDGSPEIEPNGSAPSGARWRGREVEVRDVILGAIDEAARHRDRRARASAAPRGRDRARLTAPSAVAKVRGLEANGAVLLDEDWMPPCLPHRGGARPARVAGGAGRQARRHRQGPCGLRGRPGAAGRRRHHRPPGAPARQPGPAAGPPPRGPADRCIPRPSSASSPRSRARPRPSPTASARRSSCRPTTTTRRPSPSCRCSTSCGALLVELARPDRQGAVPIPFRLHPSGVRTASGGGPDAVHGRHLHHRRLGRDPRRDACASGLPQQTRSARPRSCRICPLSRLRGIPASAAAGGAARRSRSHRRHDLFRARPPNAYWRRLPGSAGLAIGVMATGPSWRWSAGRSGTEPMTQDDPSGSTTRRRTHGHPPAAGRHRPAADRRRAARTRASGGAAAGGDAGPQPAGPGGARPAAAGPPPAQSANPPADPDALLRRVEGELKRFEQRAQALGADPQQVSVGTCVLCALLDDVVLNTPWGAHGIWKSRGLAATLHRDVDAGERFFDLLRQHEREPGAVAAVLELWPAAWPWASRAAIAPPRPSPASRGRPPRGARRDPGAPRGPQPAELSPHWRGVEVGAPAAARGGAALGRRHRDAGPPRPDLRRPPLRLGGYADRLGPAGRRPAAGRATSRSSAPGRAAKPPPQASGRNRHLLHQRRRPRPGPARRRAPRACTSACRARACSLPASAVLDQGVTPLIECIGDQLDKQRGRILVMGHTDDLPIRSRRFPSNQALSEARAEAVRAVLARRLHESGRITTQGKADTGPGGQQRHRGRPRRQPAGRDRAAPMRHDQLRAPRHAPPERHPGRPDRPLVRDPGRCGDAVAADLVLRRPRDGRRAARRWRPRPAPGRDPGRRAALGREQPLAPGTREEAQRRPGARARPGDLGRARLGRGRRAGAAVRRRHRPAPKRRSGPPGRAALALRAALVRDDRPARLAARPPRCSSPACAFRSDDRAASSRASAARATATGSSPTRRC